MYDVRCMMYDVRCVKEGGRLRAEGGGRKSYNVIMIKCKNG
jgi:hypothetical protein